MNPPAPAGPRLAARSHLQAATLALALAVAAVVAGCHWGADRERRSFHALMPSFVEYKDHVDTAITSAAYIDRLKGQGIALQRRAFERRDVLPLYGSSELNKKIPDKSSLFFLNLPTGFSVFPVGKAGATSLIIFEKLAALGDTARHKRVALSISPSWFYHQSPAEHWYLGNFSRQQALSALLNPRLALHFRHGLAQRMLLHPETLEKDPLLRFLVTHLAAGGRAGRVTYYGAWPLAKLQQALFTMQDHYENARYLRAFPPPLLPDPVPQSQSLDWDRLIAEAAAQPNPTAVKATINLQDTQFHNRDELFRRRINSASEWKDFDLMLRGLREMGVTPLVLCMPPNGVFFENGGISKESLDLFAARIRAISEKNGALVRTFTEHQEDINFFVDHLDHLSAKGWMYYNRELDSFYHSHLGRIEGTATHSHRKHAHSVPTLGRS